MKNLISSLKNVKVLSQDEQKQVNGAGGCCNPDSPFGINYPRICSMLPPCSLQ